MGKVFIRFHITIPFSEASPLPLGAGILAMLAHRHENQREERLSPIVCRTICLFNLAHLNLMQFWSQSYYKDSVLLVFPSQAELLGNGRPHGWGKCTAHTWGCKHKAREICGQQDEHYVDKYRLLMEFMKLLGSAMPKGTIRTRKRS